jgi:hypothetical protein
VVAELDLSENLIKAMSEMLLKSDSDINDAIVYLDQLEAKCLDDYNRKGTYELSEGIMFMNILFINDLIKLGKRQNDDNYGFLILNEN